MGFDDVIDGRCFIAAHQAPLGTDDHVRGVSGRFARSADTRRRAREGRLWVSCSGSA